MPAPHAFLVHRSLASGFPMQRICQQDFKLCRRHHLILIIHLGKLHTHPIWAAELHPALPVSLLIPRDTDATPNVEPCALGLFWFSSCFLFWVPRGKKNTVDLILSDLRFNRLLVVLGKHQSSLENAFRGPAHPQQGSGFTLVMGAVGKATAVACVPCWPPTPDVWPNLI